MNYSLLKSIEISKYGRLLPRVFPGAARFMVHDRHGKRIWESEESRDTDHDDADSAWVELAGAVQRRNLPGGRIQVRSSLRSRESGVLGWLLVEYAAADSVPMTTASDALLTSFSDATAFLQDDIELQSECNQLAVELTERYEELNLVYATKDQVEYFEEGQEALSNLVHNCTDYLNVGFAALICRERNLMYHSSGRGVRSINIEKMLDLLGASIYDCVESQVSSIIINEVDDENRSLLFGGRHENLLAYPVIDNHNLVIGIVAVVAEENSHIFSNGDRNLLEVMAKKAARIINTHHDSLTGLMNRRGFEPALIAALSTAHSNKQEHCLLHIDIDQLHVINDLMGQQEGDALIRRVSKLLRSALRDSDTLARLSGDEFAVLLPNCSIEQGKSVAEKIRLAAHTLQVISASRQLDVTLSSGIASIDDMTEGIVGVMAAAEIACKAAKEAGRDRTQVFALDNTTLVRRSEQIEWIGRVKHALQHDRFVLFCQPVLAAENPNRAPHYEILIRLLDDDGEIMSPDTFMPAAERYQLMPQIDRWVIATSLRLLSEIWREIRESDTVFCINLSGQSLTNPGFKKFVGDELDRTGAPAENICFEVTETAAISNIDEALDFIEAMKKRGSRFSLDDFGAGLSSFGYLKLLPVNYLKIDGSFVREITSDAMSRSIVEAICKIGETMSLSTVAEYVGDTETVELLREMGVNYLQGFHIGTPGPLVDTIESIRVNDMAAHA